MPDDVPDRNVEGGKSSGVSFREGFGGEEGVCHTTLKFEVEGPKELKARLLNGRAGASINVEPGIS